MTHDKFCQDNGLGCGEYFCDEPCICEIVANVRADEREQAARRVSEAEHWSHIITDDTLAVLCGPDDLTVEEYEAVQRGMRIAAYVARYSLDSAINMARSDKAARGGEQA